LKAVVKDERRDPWKRLGEITPADAMAEGGYTVEEFKDVWRRINGTWDPNEEVTVYDFKLLRFPQQTVLTGHKEGVS